MPIQRLRMLIVLAFVAAWSISSAAVRADGQSVVTVIEDTGDRIVLQYQFPAHRVDQVMLDGETWDRLWLGNEVLKYEKGYPAVPAVSRGVIIPDNGQMQVRVLSSDWHELSDIVIPPSKGHLDRSVDPSTVPLTFSKAYEQDAWWPAEDVTLRSPHIFRDLRGVVATANPVQYNPVQRVARVCREMTIEIRKAAPGGTSTLAPGRFVHKAGKSWNLAFDHHFVNYRSSGRYDPLEEDGDLLIICHDDFVDEMADFITHKQLVGISTTIETISSIGNDPDDIKDRIEEVYDAGDLSFVLIVGDFVQVTSPTEEFPYNGGVETGAMDPTYGHLDGDDHYPEVLVGRMSAETSAHVTTQVARSIAFETSEATQEDFYNRGTGIASDESGDGGDNGESDTEHMTNIRTRLINAGLDSVDAFYDPGVTDEQIVNAVNAGRGLVNYCGHGSSTNWTTSQFNNADINDSLTNVDALPWVISVGCNNGEFHTGTTFAEAWLRATDDDGEPTGASCAYMSSIRQLWSPPMRAQDNIVDLFIAEDYQSGAALMMAGSCGMIDAYGAGGDKMIKTWHFFGDPTLCVTGVIEYADAHLEGDDLESAGPAGGPFNPESVTWTLHNDSDEEIVWTGLVEENWLLLNADGGTLPAGDMVEVQASFSAAAGDLPNSVYEQEVLFQVEGTDLSFIRNVKLSVGVPAVVESWTLDEDPGWALQGEWAFGQPTGEGGDSYGNPDPDSGATGDNVIGVNLTGDYNPNVPGDYSVSMPAFDATNFRNTTLAFQSWLNIDVAPYAFVTLTVASDSSSVSWDSDESQADDTWQSLGFDISAVADGEPNVTVTWTYTVANSAYPYSGWNIDDITIWAIEDGNELCAGDANGDGSVDVEDVLHVLDNYGDPYTVDDLLEVIGAWGSDCG